MERANISAEQARKVASISQENYRKPSAIATCRGRLAGIA